jgi:sugar/nucleoside kinase (ribokinase family)
MEISLEPIQVMYVESPNGPEGAGEAFNKLEAGLATLKGRKFYATFQYPDGPYRACVAIEKGDDPAALGLAVGVIPGGSYARGKLENWSERPWEIPDAFTRLSEAYRVRIDQSRPSIEFYKSQKELIMLVPVLPSE